MPRVTPNQSPRKHGSPPSLIGQLLFQTSVVVTAKINSAKTGLLSTNQFRCFSSQAPNDKKLGAPTPRPAYLQAGRVLLGTNWSLRRSSPAEKNPKVVRSTVDGRSGTHACIPRKATKAKISHLSRAGLAIRQGCIGVAGLAGARGKTCNTPILAVLLQHDAHTDANFLTQVQAVMA